MCYPISNRLRSAYTVSGHSSLRGCFDTGQKYATKYLVVGLFLSNKRFNTKSKLKYIPFARTFSRIAYPGGRNGRLNILIYHRVLDNLDPLDESIPDAKRFRWQMSLLQRYFNVLPLSKAVDLLYAGLLPSRSICITFDDGYRDNLEIAAPILKELGLPATLFIASDFLNIGIMWNDRIIEAVRNTSLDIVDLASLGLDVYHLNDVTKRRSTINGLLQRLKYLPIEERDRLTSVICDRLGGGSIGRLMLNPHEVLEIVKYGFQIGGHTVSHPILASMKAEESALEIGQGKADLEELLQDSIGIFAYPNGRPSTDYTSLHVQQVEETGFRAAVTTRTGVATGNDDRYQLPRFTPWDDAPVKFFFRLVLHGLDPKNRIFG